MTEEEKEKKKSGNPVMGFLDQALTGIRKFLAEQKMLKVADELTYLALRKVVDFLKNTFIPINIEGQENIPDFKPAILTSIVEEPIDLFIGTALTPRKIHFMFPAKLYESPGMKPLLDAIGAFRSTKSKDDMEPIQNVIKFINQEQDFVAMVPIDNGDREMLVKQYAGIIKFASGIPTQIIPYAGTSIKHYSLGKHINIKVGEPIDVDKKISRNRDERYKLASDIVDKIMSLKADLIPEKKE
ncbi:MAG: lysophospholipid acyltransferase family protein [Promethearchaeota archaeon]